MGIMLLDEKALNPRIEALKKKNTSPTANGAWQDHTKSLQLFISED
jgi:hypothetical protein